MPGKQEMEVGLRCGWLSYMNKGLKGWEIIIIFTSNTATNHENRNSI
ncbi:MAG: hypothetical protein J6Y78_15525 [Paludibacteraceae bacterium]|nr:hypothetical protein [Paludibacteraceae bacterium]